MFLLTVLATAFAGLTLLIVVWQEYRRWRERPQGRITVDKVGHFTRSPGDERWELIEVVNCGDARLTNLRAAWIGMTLLDNGAPDSQLAYKLPPTMDVGQIVTLGAQSDDLDRAYVKVVGKRAGSRLTVVQWFPIVMDGDADNVWTRQIRESQEGRALRRRPHRWRPSRRPSIRQRPGPVGPYVGGVRRVIIKDRAPDFGEQLDAALGRDAKALDGFASGWP